MVIIVGAGLSGLLTAYRLKQAKIPFKILEANARVGGRIYTKLTANKTPVEMGATWFGKQHQNLIKLLNELNLTAFPQYNGQHFFFDDPESPHHGKHQLPQQEANYRISGGSKALIDSLYNSLDEQDILLNCKVSQIEESANNILITTETKTVFEADQIVVSVPPKIWSHQIKFTPKLPDSLLGIAQNTQTWMEDSIKAALEFKSAFWKEYNIPSTIMSKAGPFVECYDHSNSQEDKFALCGFLNPALIHIDREQREKEVVHQLSAILGEEVKKYLSYQEYVWSQDDLVKWPKDNLMQPHQNNGHSYFREPYANGRLIISSSESAATFPGYMDGAVEAGERAFREILEQRSEQ